MHDAPWIFPGLAGTRWVRVALDALARAELPDTGGGNNLNDPVFCDAWVRGLAARRGADHSWGGWQEDRSHLWRGHYLPHGCSIHVGIDLNAIDLNAIDLNGPAGTVVPAPLSGRVVHASPCRVQGGGWGGWCVLKTERTRCRCGAAYLLLGHLAHAGLPQPGARLVRGQAVGCIGAPAENGGWYPHLHLQALSDSVWEAVRRAPDTLLDGNAYPATDLPQQFPDPAPPVGLPREGDDA